MTVKDARYVVLSEAAELRLLRLDGRVEVFSPNLDDASLDFYDVPVWHAGRAWYFVRFEEAA